MFTIDPTITDLRMKERSLFRVLFSMNVHQVANPEMSLEDARSYVFFWRESGKVKAYIGLHFIPTDRRMYYSHSSNPFPEDTLADVEAEARTFAEDLGAMLDELDISRLSLEEKDRWIDDQEFLSGRKASETVIEEKSEPAAVPPAPLEPAPLLAASVLSPMQAEPAPVQAAPIVPPTMQPALMQTAPVVPPVQPPSVPMHAAPVVPPLRTAAPPVQTVQKEPSASSRAAAVSPRDTGKEQSSRRKGAARQEPAKPDNSVPEQTASLPPAGQHADVVLEEAVKAGVVKAPKAQLKQEIRASGGTISRDKEALARLLASF